MTPEKRRSINRFADAIRQDLALVGPPYDMERAVEQLGGRLERLSEFDLLAPEASVSKRGSRFLIKVRPTHRQRERFSVAHELGHLFLHMGYLVDEATWNSCNDFDELNRQGTGEQEYEAHEFAGALLMPEAKFREIAERHRNGSC